MPSPLVQPLAVRKFLSPNTKITDPVPHEKVLALAQRNRSAFSTAQKIEAAFLDDLSKYQDGPSLIARQT